MYLPSQFEEKDPHVLHDFIRRNPLATLITPQRGGLNAEHLPMLLETAEDNTLVLRGHVARANPVWRALDAGGDALAVFLDRGRYITPSWYASKAETGRVVPTWNYTAVHVHGNARAIEDPLWLKAFLGRLTDASESARPAPWRIADAPTAYIDAQLKAIVGIEFAVTSMTGKWKMSQNRLRKDAQGVIRGLRESGEADARRMADEIDARTRRD